MRVEDAAEILLRFLKSGPLTEVIASLEHRLSDTDGPSSQAIVADADIMVELLTATMKVRAELGRMSDLIHAAGIVLALPHLLEPGERIKGRPSLAAGNDPTRPFDLETDRRIAEFKLSKWMSGSNAMRKRQTFKDLVALAMDDSGRRAELYVLGPKPATFLRGTKSTAAWALNRVTTDAFREKFKARFGSLDVPIADFTATHAKHVVIVDLVAKLPELFAPLDKVPQPEVEELLEP